MLYKKKQLETNSCRDLATRLSSVELLEWSFTTIVQYWGRDVQTLPHLTRLRYHAVTHIAIQTSREPWPAYRLKDHLSDC